MVLLQVEQEGVTVKGSPHFNPDPDAEILYKAMKGIGEWTSMACYWRTGPLWGFASALTALESRCQWTARDVGFPIIL